MTKWFDFRKKSSSGSNKSIERFVALPGDTSWDDRHQSTDLEEPSTSDAKVLKNSPTLSSASSVSSSSDAADDNLSSSHASSSQVPKTAVETIDQGGIDKKLNNSVLLVVNDDDEETLVMPTQRKCCAHCYPFFKRNKAIKTRLLCWNNWTRRERILLAIVVLNSILVLILFSTTVAYSQQIRSSHDAAGLTGATFEVSGSKQVTCEDGNSPTTDNSVKTTTDDGSAPTSSGNNNNNNSSGGGSSYTFNIGGGNSENEGNAEPSNVENNDDKETTTSTGSSSTNTGSTSTATQDGFDPNSLCGCASCTESVWNNMAGEFTCGERIQYLASEFSTLYPTQMHACRRIAFEFNCDCGGCDPARCNIPTDPFELPDASWTPPRSSNYLPEATPVPKYTDPSLAQENQELYCFPSPGSRATYSLWGMVLQIKESSGACGPGNNRFGTSTVRIDESAGTLTLLYQNMQASEVRVLLPVAQRPFTYGTYSFSVQSVSVKSSDGTVKSKVLPKELVLGLFTWDDTENYAIHENYNHEVDIEISRWGCETNSDLQFLVQPPGFPQMHRLFTGNSRAESIEERYQQGGHDYSFTWNPGQIDWTTSAGAGTNSNFVLKTEEAVYRNVDDYVQCLPDVGKNLEVRINLWNMYGAQPLEGLSSTDVVEVVFDNFSFVPSGQTHLPIGSICSKHCQCESGVAECLGNICTAI